MRRAGGKYMAKTEPRPRRGVHQGREVCNVGGRRRGISEGQTSEELQELCQ